MQEKPTGEATDTTNNFKSILKKIQQREYSIFK